MGNREQRNTFLMPGGVWPNPGPTHQVVARLAKEHFLRLRTSSTCAMSGECKPVHNDELSPLLIDTIGRIRGFPSQCSYEARHRETAQPAGKDDVFPSSAKLTARAAQPSRFSRGCGIRTAPIWGLMKRITELGQPVHALESIGYKRTKLPSQLSVYAS